MAAVPGDSMGSRRLRDGERSARARAPEPASQSDEPVQPGADASDLRELERLLMDSGVMLGILQRELSSVIEAPFRLVSCNVKPAKTVRSRKAIRGGRAEFVYRLRIESPAGIEHEVVLLGQAPVADGFPGP